jgi:glutaredoxin-like protein NrdH
MTVTVYTLPDCIQCEMTRKYLDKYKIEYSSIDMSNNQEATELVAQLGFKQAPVVIYDKFSWSGFRPDKVKALHLLLLQHPIPI